MKISEAAARYGVSAQAIYQRLQKSGKPLETLKAKGSKDLTAEGVAYLEAYFNKKRQDDDKQNSSVDLIRELQEKLKEAEAQIEILKSQLESAEKDAKRAEDAQQKADDLTRDLQEKLKDAEHKIELLQSQLEKAEDARQAAVEAKQTAEKTLGAERNMMWAMLPARKQKRLSGFIQVEAAAPAEEKQKWAPWWRRG